MKKKLLHSSGNNIYQYTAAAGPSLYLAPGVNGWPPTPPLKKKKKLIKKIKKEFLGACRRPGSLEPPNPAPLMTALCSSSKYQAFSYYLTP